MQTILGAKNIDIGYHPNKKDEKIIMSNLSLDLNKGELVCLLGKNGVGKSTLIRSFAGIQPILKGSISIQNKSLKNITPKQLSQKLSIVLTEKNFPNHTSVFDIVALGRFPHTNWLGKLNTNDHQIIENAIEICGLNSFKKKFINELSDGEKQKTMIARALAQDTVIMILDEPTAHLDLQNKMEIMELLRKLAHQKKKAILISTHDFDMALNTADKIWLMTKGTVFVGCPEDLIINGYFGEIFNTDNLVFNDNTGQFTLKTTKKAAVKLKGSGKIFFWTQKALERAGYNISDNAIIEIIIESTAKENFWKVKKGNFEIRCNSISKLIQSL